MRPDECIQPEELARLAASRIGAVTLIRKEGASVQYIWISVSFRPHWLLKMYKKVFHKLNIMHFLAMDSNYIIHHSMMRQ